MSAQFLESPYFHVYVLELWLLSQSIARKCQRVFDECPVREEGYYLKVSADLHTTIASILGEAANVKKLLTVPSKKGHKETREQFDFRVQRATLLAEALGSPELSEISQVATRNSVEHSDEYLDRASLMLSGAKSGQAFYNGVLSSRSMFNPHVYPLKVYVADERKYYNLEMESDLNLLHQEASDLDTRIKAVLGEKAAKEGPGGLMFRLGKS